MSYDAASNSQILATNGVAAGAKNFDGSVPYVGHAVSADCSNIQPSRLSIPDKGAYFACKGSEAFVKTGIKYLHKHPNIQWLSRSNDFSPVSNAVLTPSGFMIVRVTQQGSTGVGKIVPAIGVSIVMKGSVRTNIKNYDLLVCA